MTEPVLDFGVRDGTSGTASVGVQPPAESRGELLCSVDVGDGQDDELELHVRGRGLGLPPVESALASTVLMGTSTGGW
jgi:hypothetical protein